MRPALIAAMMLASGASIAALRVGSTMQVEREVLDAAGGRASGSSCRALYAGSQPQTGSAQSASYKISVGFLHVPLQAISLTSLPPGAFWEIGSNVDITWNASGIAAVEIELSRDGGVTWEQVVASIDASLGSYSWSVTGPASDSCVIRISDAADAYPATQSTGALRIGAEDETLPFLGGGCGTTERTAEAPALLLVAAFAVLLRRRLIATAPRLAPLD